MASARATLLSSTPPAHHSDTHRQEATLGGEQASLAQPAPAAMGMLGQLLDSNKDGSIVDDLGRLAGRFFSNNR